MEPNPHLKAVEAAIAGCAEPGKLTAEDRQNIWEQACRAVLSMTMAGSLRSLALKEIGDYLWAKVPFLVKSDNPLKAQKAINRQLYRKSEEYVIRRELKDRRQIAGKKRRAPQLSPEDRAALVQMAVSECAAELDFAWRRCLQQRKLSQELLNRYPAPRGRHARCPRAVRVQVAAEVVRLYKFHVAPHKTANSIAPMERDWSKVFAQDRYEIDDKTLDVRCRYIYEENGELKEDIIRPQMLLVIDTKSGKALGKVLIAQNNYNSLAAKTLCRNVFMATGLPKEFLMECGLWKKAKLLGNNAASANAFEQVDNFCTRVGVTLSHAIPGRARTKTIEGKFKLVDKFMLGLPGYIGNDEMHHKHERVDDAQLLTFEELDAQLDTILDSYNNTKQDSKIMGGYFTPNEVWEQCRHRDAAGNVIPVAFVPPQFEYLLTNHVEAVKVMDTGVKCSVASERYHYYSEELNDFVRGYIGQMVKLHFDPDAPETAVISDLKGTEFFAARRVPKSPAMAETDEDWQRFADASKPHRNIMRQMRERYSIIKLGYLPPACTVVADVESINRAQKMGEAKGQAQAVNRVKTAEELAEQQIADARKRCERDIEIFDLELQGFRRPQSECDFVKPEPPTFDLGAKVLPAEEIHQYKLRIFELDPSAYGGQRPEMPQDELPADNRSPGRSITPPAVSEFVNAR